MSVITLDFSVSKSGDSSILGQGSTNIPKIWEPSQNWKTQKGYMKKVNYRRYKNIMFHRTKFSRTYSSLVYIDTDDLETSAASIFRVVIL